MMRRDPQHTPNMTRSPSPDPVRPTPPAPHRGRRHFSCARIYRPRQIPDRPRQPPEPSGFRIRPDGTIYRERPGRHTRRCPDIRRKPDRPMKPDQGETIRDSADSAKQRKTARQAANPHDPGRTIPAGTIAARKSASPGNKTPKTGLRKQNPGNRTPQAGDIPQDRKYRENAGDIPGARETGIAGNRTRGKPGTWETGHGSGRITGNRARFHGIYLSVFRSRKATRPRDRKEAGFS